MAPRSKLPYSPKVGEVLYCDYGTHTSYHENAFSFDFNLPSEMVKSRMVLCLNGKLSEPLVVPISTTTPYAGNDAYSLSTAESDRFRLAMIEIHGTYRESYVKCHMIQNVSKFRLRAFNRNRFKSGKTTFTLERRFVFECQKHVLFAINMDKKLFVD